MRCVVAGLTYTAASLTHGLRHYSCRVIHCNDNSHGRSVNTSYQSYSTFQSWQQCLHYIPPIPVVFTSESWQQCLHTDHGSRAYNTYQSWQQCLHYIQIMTVVLKIHTRQGSSVHTTCQPWQQCLHTNHSSTVCTTSLSWQQCLRYISVVAVVFALHAKIIAPVYRQHTFHGSSVCSVYSRQLCLRCIPVMAVEFTLHIIHGIRVSDDTAATFTLHTSHGSIILLCMSIMAGVFTPNTNHCSSSYTACVTSCSSSNSNSISSSSSC